VRESMMSGSAYLLVAAIVGIDELSFFCSVACGQASSPKGSRQRAA